MKNMELWEILSLLKSSKYKWVDLSYEVSDKTPHYEGFRDIQTKEVLSFATDKVCSIEYTLVSQYGTHVDPPYHFIQGGRRLHQIGIKDFVFPLCIIDASQKVAENHDYGLTREDIEEWESIFGPIPENSFVAMRSDWYKREGAAFTNKDAEGNCHYPGWTKAALQYLCEVRKVGAIGHEPSDTDPAITQTTDLWAGERYYLEKDKYQVEMLRNLDQLPAKGAIIFCTFPAVRDAPGFTARCFAICPNE